MRQDSYNEALKAFAHLNPVSAERIVELERAPERERTYALIVARQEESAKSRSRVRLRRAAITTIALVVVLAVVPALALSGKLGSLFRFSNEGTGIDTKTRELRTASALDISGATPGTLKLLASRAGVGIYVARDKSGSLCYFLGPSELPGERGLGGGCLNAEASARFPSPEQPVIDMTAFVYKPGASGERVTRLVGVAADGVARVQVLGVDCGVIAEALVVDNVYVEADIPDAAAVGIQALGQTGERVYLRKLHFWDSSACTNRSGTTTP
jgi:hypothetical protein